jgi:predicted DNA-binding transcriptional regulator AlpA
MATKDGKPSQQKRKFTAQVYKAQPIPEVGFVRLPSILAAFPVGRTTWLNGVRDGKYPAPIRLGARTVAWRVEDIRELLKGAQ